MIAAGLLLLTGITVASAAPETRFDFMLDPRLELAGTVEMISTPSSGTESAARVADFILPQPKERALIERRFGSFRAHAAVRLHAEPEVRTFMMDARGQVLLRLTEPPALEEITSSSPGVYSSGIGGSELVDRWIGSLRAFARDARYMEYHREASHRLEPEIARYKREIITGDYLAKIESYTGMRYRGRYRFVFTRFMRQGAAMLMVTHHGGAVQITSIVGPDEEAPPESRIRFPIFPDDIWHESAHGILDESTDRFREEFSAKQALFIAPTRDCHDWHHCVREHITQAVAARLVRAELGAAAAEKVLADAVKTGLPYMQAIDKCLEEYEANRKRYPTLFDFYPRILAAFPESPPASRPQSAP